MFNNKVIALFNAHTLEILTFVTPNETNFDIDIFIQNKLQYDPDYQHFKPNDIGYSTISKNTYEKYGNVEFSNLQYKIHPETKQLICEMNKRTKITSADISYTSSPHKRNFTVEQVYKMYYEDYINCSLRSAIESGIFEAKFIPLKDLNIRPGVTKRNWCRFDKDPYLNTMYDDKLKLGRSVVDIGTYYPFIVGKHHADPDNIYVFEGNHRLFSLKLLVMAGEISDDFKVLCLYMPENYSDFKLTNKPRHLSKLYRYRYVLEDFYGCDILADDELLNMAKESVQRNSEIFVNDYTVEGHSMFSDNIINSIHNYPLFLRDLIFLHQDKILPSPVINNEEAFNKWLKG